MMKKALLGVALLVVAVSGCGQTDSRGTVAAKRSKELAALNQYRSYLSAHSKWVVYWAAKAKDQIDHHELPWAQPSFEISRVHYGQIETLAASQAPALARSVGTVPAKAARHEPPFLELEKGLFAEETTAHLKKDAAQLVAAAKELQGRLSEAELTPSDLLHQASRQMHATAAATASGRAAPYSQQDLVSISAELEGAGAAARAAELCLPQTLRTSLRKRFEEAYAVVEQLGFTAREAKPPDPESGSGMHAFSDLSKSERLALATLIDELSGALAEGHQAIRAASDSAC